MFQQNYQLYCIELFLLMGIVGCGEALSDNEFHSESSLRKGATHNGKHTTLRWYPASLSEKQIRDCIYTNGFYEQNLHPDHDVDNVYIRREIDGDIVVIDSTHRLMWASGIVAQASYNNMSELIATMDYASFHDWRIPTIEELVSLLEPKQGEMYCDIIFSDFQGDSVWSSDLVAGHSEEKGWLVRFDLGIIIAEDCNVFRHIMPVRNIDNLPFDSKTGASIRGLRKDW